MPKRVSFGGLEGTEEAVRVCQNPSVSGIGVSPRGPASPEHHQTQAAHTNTHALHALDATCVIGTEHLQDEARVQNSEDQRRPRAHARRPSTPARVNKTTHRHKHPSHTQNITTHRATTRVHRWFNVAMHHDTPMHVTRNTWRQTNIAVDHRCSSAHRTRTCDTRAAFAVFSGAQGDNVHVTIARAGCAHGRPGARRRRSLVIK